MNNKEITIFESLDSTNNYAMQQIHAGMAAHGDTFLALRQTAGKGQHGKVWLAEEGESILMSTILDITMINSPVFPIGINQQFQLSALVAVATREWFANYAGNNIFIKWPNDIYCNDRKAGGILIENVIGRKVANDGWQMAENDRQPSSAISQPPSSNWKWAVVGIGVNINQQNFPYYLLNPISLRLITGVDYDILELAKTLNSAIEKYWEKWMAGEWKTIFETYNKHLFKRGQPVRLRKGNIIMPCTIKGVSETGKLLIEEDDAVEFTVGEVSWEMAFNV